MAVKVIADAPLNSPMIDSNDRADRMSWAKWFRDVSELLNKNAEDIANLTARVEALEDL